MEEIWLPRCGGETTRRTRLPGRSDLNSLLTRRRTGTTEIWWVLPDFDFSSGPGVDSPDLPSGEEGFGSWHQLIHQLNFSDICHRRFPL